MVDSLFLGWREQAQRLDRYINFLLCSVGSTAKYQLPNDSYRWGRTTTALMHILLVCFDHIRGECECEVESFSLSSIPPLEFSSWIRKQVLT